MLTINSKTQTDQDIDPNKPFVCFGSFQDFLGKSKSGGMKAKHEWTRGFNWDCVVLDEYHFGAWREDAQELIGSHEDMKEQKKDLKAFRKILKETEKELNQEVENPDYFDEDLMPFTARHYLYLSGTPFRALASGDFIEDEIYNWTYSDEQRAKENWENEHASNPYASLPRMVLMTYQLPPSIASVASEGEFDEFDLNTFFLAEGEGDEAVFRFHDDVQKWLDLLQLEPGLFSKVTGLTKKDFELLVNLGVFNEALMNDAVFKFKRYEDSSLTYGGINKHEEDEKVGLWSTTISRDELEAQV